MIYACNSKREIAKYSISDERASKTQKVLKILHEKAVSEAPFKMRIKFSFFASDCRLTMDARHTPQSTEVNTDI